MSHDTALSGPRTGSDRASEYPAGRNLSGLHGRHGRAHAGDCRAAVGSGHGDRERSRSAVAGDGAANTAEYWDRIEFQHGAFSELNHTGAGRLAGGSGREPVSADGRGTRIFIFGGRAAGYAPGSNQGHDGGRSAESQCRKSNSRLALPARRRKESAEDSWSNVPSVGPFGAHVHLADVVERAVPRTGPMHPATRTFMALRMVVNREQEELDALLERAPRMVKSGRTDRHHFISCRWKTAK